MLSAPNPSPFVLGDRRGRRSSPAATDWVLVADLLLDPERIQPLVAAAGRRFGSDDRKLLLHQVARESIAGLVTAAVEMWTGQRRLVDLSAANVVLGAGEDRTLAGILEERLCVLADDAARLDQPGVEVLSEVEMFDRFVDQVVGYPVESGAVPPGSPASIAAVAAVVATVRRLIRTGDRHLWGTAALAVASTLARLSHAGGERVDRDRAALFGTRPDLARTLDLVTVDDPRCAGGRLTFGVRRTCCLLLKLPGGPQCATCSLCDRQPQVAVLADWYLAERWRQRD